MWLNNVYVTMGDQLDRLLFNMKTLDLDNHRQFSGS